MNSTGTAITTTVPAETTTGPVQVVTPSGTLSSNLPFRVLPAVSSFAPTHGAIGTVVTINGQSLTQTTGVTFGDVPAAFAVVSDSEITAMAPTGALTGSITVTTAGGVATAEGTFRVFKVTPATIKRRFIWVTETALFSSTRFLRRGIGRHLHG